HSTPSQLPIRKQQKNTHIPYTTLFRSVQETEKDIDEVQDEIDELEKKIEERFEILKDRAKSYQENGGNSQFIDVLFDAEDFSDFISRVSAISTIPDAVSNL